MVKFPRIPEVSNGLWIPTRAFHKRTCFTSLFFDRRWKLTKVDYQKLLGFWCWFFAGVNIWIGNFVIAQSFVPFESLVSLSRLMVVTNPIISTLAWTLLEFSKIFNFGKLLFKVFRKMWCRNNENKILASQSPQIFNHFIGN